MNPPKSITLASQRITIRVESVKKKQGRYHSMRQVIQLHPDQSPDSMAETLLHEVLHATWAQTPLAVSEIDEELVVRALSPILFDALRRNPALTAYITTRSKP